MCFVQTITIASTQTRKKETRKRPQMKQLNSPKKKILATRNKTKPRKREEQELPRYSQRQNHE